MAPPIAADALCQGGERAREVTALLHRAQELAPTRPEAHYNEGLWLLWLSGRCRDPKSSIPVLDLAAASFRRFVALAASDPTRADDVADAQQRIREPPLGRELWPPIQVAEEAPPPAVWPGDLP